MSRGAAARHRRGAPPARLRARAPPMSGPEPAGSPARAAGGARRAARGECWRRRARAAPPSTWWAARCATGCSGGPLCDVDLVVEPGADATRAALAQAAARPGDAVVAHERFGTVALRRGDAAVDLATVAARDATRTRARSPRVEPAPLDEDLRRRDFSVNALALPLSRAARARHAGIVDPDRRRRGRLGARTLRVLPRAELPRRSDPRAAGRPARRRGSASASRAARVGAARRAARRRLRPRVRRAPAPRARARSSRTPPAGSTRRARCACSSDWHVLGGARARARASAPRRRAPLRRLGRAIATPPWPAARWRPLGGGARGVARAARAAAAAAHAAPLRGARRASPSAIAALPALRDRTLRALARARGRGAIDALLARARTRRSCYALYAWAPPRAAPAHRALRARGPPPAAAGQRRPTSSRWASRVRPSAARSRACARAWLDGAVQSREEALALARGGRAAAPRRAAAARRSGPRRSACPRDRDRRILRPPPSHGARSIGDTAGRADPPDAIPVRPGAALDRSSDRTARSTAEPFVDDPGRRRSRLRRSSCAGLRGSARPAAAPDPASTRSTSPTSRSRGSPSSTSSTSS